MPRGPQRGLAGWGLILLLTTPLIIERAPSLAIQLFFFAHQTYGTMTSLSIPSTSSGSSISLSKLASTAFALFEHYIGAMVPLIYQTYSCHSLPSYIHWPPCSRNTTSKNGNEHYFFHHVAQVLSSNHL